MKTKKKLKERMLQGLFTLTMAAFMFLCMGKTEVQAREILPDSIKEGDVLYPGDVIMRAGKVGFILHDVNNGNKRIQVADGVDLVIQDSYRGMKISEMRVKEVTNGVLFGVELVESKEVVEARKELLESYKSFLKENTKDVNARPRLMPDGTVFDVVYYRKNNPDVVAVLGRDENTLFTHYTLYGKNEGRKPCEDGAVPMVLINPYDNEVIVENTKPTAPVDGKPTGTGEYIDADGNEWTMKRTWTASNGVILKIRDKYSHWDFENNMAARNVYDAREVLIMKGLDLRPGTPDFVAIVEFEYGTGAYQGGVQKMLISAANLPLVATPVTKQTSVPETDSWYNYVTVFNPLWSYQSTGDYESPAELYNYGSGIGLLTGVVSSYIWNLDYIGDCWKLTIRGALTELQWNSVRNSLRLVSPDGEQLYQEFYKQFYEDNPTFPAYNTWVPIGGSEAMILSPEDTKYPTICFR